MKHVTYKNWESSWLIALTVLCTFGLQISQISMLNSIGNTLRDSGKKYIHLKTHPREEALLLPLPLHYSARMQKMRRTPSLLRRCGSPSRSCSFSSR